jgi:hypothetical protein
MALPPTAKITATALPASQQAAAAPKPEPAPTTPPKPTAAALYVVNTAPEGLSLRPQPGASDRLKVLPDGSRVEAIGEQQHAAGRPWTRIRDGEGTEGWVAAEFLSDSPPSAQKPAAPAEEPAAAASPPSTRPQQVAPAADKSSRGVAPTSARDCPSTHPIKGNQGSRSTNEWIYHPPGSRSYAATAPEECFATAAEAAAAGYRAPRN